MTLEPSVAARLKSEMRRTCKTLKAVVNDALTRGLGGAGRPPRAPRFEVRPQALGFKPGIDLDRLYQLLDELESTDSTRS